MKKHLLASAVAIASSVLLSACIDNIEDETETTSRAQVTRGTIDGFGSVIVGGVHFDSDGATFSVDDRAGAQADLRVGQVVTVKGSHDGAEGVALEIIYDVNVEGTVTAVDASAGTLTVLGQVITTDAMTVFEALDLATLSTGVRVEVSGYASGNGSILATYVALDDQDQDDEELSGTLAQLDTGAQTFRIGQQTVSYASLTSMDLDGASLANGLSVEVEGRLSGDIFVASSIEAEERDFEEETELEMQGVILAVNSETQEITVNGLTVRYDDETEFEHGGIAALVVGARVELEGYVDADGVLIAEEIEFEDTVEIKLEGQVQATTATTVTVMGVEVTVDARTRVRDQRDDETYFNLEMLQTGDYVELVVQQTADGQYRARRLERDETEAESSVSAPIDALDIQAGTVTLLGLSFNIGQLAPSLIASLSVGLSIEIEGTFDGSVFTVVSLEVDEQD